MDRTGHHDISVSRRVVLAGGSALAGGLILGFSLSAPSSAQERATNAPANARAFAPNAWLQISPDNQITVIIDKSEMGQGIMTALAMIVAEELDGDFAQVSAKFARNDPVYKNTLLGSQLTGGSTGVPSSWDNLRKVGATARAMLLEAGARELGVAKSECATELSKVIHRKSGKTVSYGDLAESAAKLKVPENVPLKSKADYTLIGKPIARLDTPAKVAASAQFGVDVEMAGLLTATVVHPPVFGSKLAALNPRKAKAIAGVRDVFEISSGVAIVADNFWRASKAAHALQITWSKSPHEGLSDAKISAQLRRRKAEAGSIARKDGALDEALASAAKVLTATYETPYMGHSTPEPMNCTAHVTDKSCEVWVPTQAQTIAEMAAAVVTGFDARQITVHTTFLGGGFGRRIEPDVVREAVEISKRMRAPVKVIWPRAEDIQHDAFHPATVIEMRAGLAADGSLTAWSHHLIAPSHMAPLMDYHRTARIPEWLPDWLRTGVSQGVSLVIDNRVFRDQATAGAHNWPYAVKNVEVSYTREEPGVPVGNWRAVAYHYNCFAAESFIDEAAAAAGADPRAFRLALLKNEPRLANVLKLATAMAQWGTALPERVGRGIAILDFKGTRVALLAEVEVASDGALKVKKVWCALDCGIVINPKTVVQQVESAVAFGLTAALKTGVRIEGGKVTQSNFHDMPMLRMSEMPDVEVQIVESSASPTGIGEAPVPVVAPALANAIYAATGKRIRKLPVTAKDLT